jgi:hypothetical protein
MVYLKRIIPTILSGPKFYIGSIKETNSSTSFSYKLMSSSSDPWVRSKVGLNLSGS